MNLPIPKSLVRKNITQAVDTQGMDPDYYGRFTPSSGTLAPFKMRTRVNRDVASRRTPSDLWIVGRVSYNTGKNNQLSPRLNWGAEREIALQKARDSLLRGYEPPKRTPDGGIILPKAPLEVPIDW